MIFFQQERGFYLHKNFDIDEETRYSSVYRDKGVDDSGYDENEDIVSDSHNSETFGDTFASVVMRSREASDGKDDGGVRAPLISSSKVSCQSFILSKALTQQQDALFLLGGVGFIDSTTLLLYIRNVIIGFLVD